MALSVTSRLVRSEGLRHFLAIELAGDAGELSAVRTVSYDLGPTFDEPERFLNASGAPPFAVEAATFGDFTVTAQVTRTDERIEVLYHSTTLNLQETVAGDIELGGSAPALRQAPHASARAVMHAQLALALTVLALGVLLVVAWPAGADVIGILVWRVPVSLDMRLLLVAVAAGGLGALVQAALTLAAYVGNRNVHASWIGWYLLRGPTGMALAAIGYGLLRTVLLGAQAGSAALSPVGVAALAFAAGYLSPRVTTALRDRLRTLFETSDVDKLRVQATETPDPEISDPIERATAERERQRRANIELAVQALRGKDATVQHMYNLADDLRDVNEFGLARRLYHRVRARADWSHLNKTAVKVGQRHALATYKDPDLPAAGRFDRALEILAEIEQLDFAAPPAGVVDADPASAASRAIEQRQESLGLRGAVYKRRWQIEGQHSDLECAAGHYLSAWELGRRFIGNELGVETDQGYTGINAAFMLDLLAVEDAKQATDAGVTPSVAIQRYKDARAIRELLAAKLPQLVARSNYTWLRKMWWFHATLAEAHFGLGNFDAAITALCGYNTALDLGHTRPPLEKIPSWQFESTFAQLTSLALVQSDLQRMLGAVVESVPTSAANVANDQNQPVNPGATALRAYLGSLAPALDRAEIGKVGLALSGGGFRASLFHIGVLAYLAERDVLRRVEVLSCVSGGSIVGAHFYLLVKHLLQAKADAVITRDDYLRIVEDLSTEFLAAVQTNIRSQVYGSVWANLRAFFQPGYTTTRRLGALYEREIYARVVDGGEGRPRHLTDLCVRPPDEPATFKPKYDNWRRRAKVPMLVLNATTLNTGHNWQFTASWMGEPPIGLDREIEGNYLLRRMYHDEAPRLKDRWRHWYSRWLAPPDYRRMRLGEAVAASSGVPGLFEPLVLPDLFDGKIVRLVDGGVHDNQGVASLLEQDCTVMIVSDASGQMDTQDDPKASRLGVSLRSFSVSMTRVRQAQFRELAARRRSGLLKGLMFLHLKRDLEADPVDWRDCQDPHDGSADARPGASRQVLTRYGIQKDVQRLLSGLRTDLDSFTDLEAFSLMTSGYRQAEAEFRSLPGLTSLDRAPRSWAFLGVAPFLGPGPAFEEAKRQLGVGSKSAFKLWLLSRWLQALAVALGLAALFGSFRLWQIYKDVELTIPVAFLVKSVLWIAAAAIAPRVVALVRYRKSIHSLGLKSLGAAAVALAFKVHLLVFDPIFLKIGSLVRLRKRT